MRSLYKAIENIADINENVLIYGENGVGRTLVAQAVHQASLKSSEPFIKQNCAALNNEQSRKEILKLIKDAGNGTLLLHNIDYLHADAQADLFILLEDKPNARIICSCSTPPLEAVRTVSYTHLTLPTKA